MSSLVQVDSDRSLAFKGIAVFTPGGDLVYCRDRDRQGQWHVHLCGTLQEHLGLAESPHFLVPYFTATVDRWIDTATQELQTVAEIYPPLLRYQGLLNALFDLGDVEWQIVHPLPESCSPSVFATYQEQFPQLWDSHHLVLDVSRDRDPNARSQEIIPETEADDPVLRLFVSGHSALTEQILRTLQSVLETTRHRPYTLKVIDVSKHPEQAEADQISATPTLVRVWPHPVKRLVGELNDPISILSLLTER